MKDKKQPRPKIIEGGKPAMVPVDVNPSTAPQDHDRQAGKPAPAPVDVAPQSPPPEEPAPSEPAPSDSSDAKE